MKKYLIGIIIALGFLCSTVSAHADITPWECNGLYARCCAITQIEYSEDGVNLIIVQDCNGFEFAYYDDAEDLLVGDVMSIIFDMNGTEEVMDDIIIAARYDRPDLLPLE